MDYQEFRKLVEERGWTLSQLQEGFTPLEVVKLVGPVHFRMYVSRLVRETKYPIGRITNEGKVLRKAGKKGQGKGQAR